MCVSRGANVAIDSRMGRPMVAVMDGLYKPVLYHHFLFSFEPRPITCAV